MRISPLIYGTNGPQNPTQNRYTLLRSGGNRMTAYNWENNASNAGSDYQYQNDGYLGGGNTPGGAVMPTLQNAYDHNAAALIAWSFVATFWRAVSHPALGSSPQYARRFRSTST